MTVHQVVALAMPHVVAFDLSIVAQVFGRPDEPQYGFSVVTPDGRNVLTSTGFTIGSVAGPNALRRADTIVIPGYEDRTPPPAQVVAALQGAAARGTRVVSVCTGAFALAATGLLDGRRATTHWQHAELLRTQYPRVEVDPDVLYIDHGQVATSAGVAAGIDLCLHLVRRDHGEDLAAQIARRMVVPPHRTGGQAQYIKHAPSCDRADLIPVLDWARDHLETPVTVARWSRQAGMSQRTFARRFQAAVGTTPLQWLTHQRVLEARRLLETTDLPISHVARRTGLGTATNLRRHIMNEVGVAPSQYRRTFRAPAGPASPGAGVPE